MQKSFITTALLMNVGLSATTGFCDTRKGEEIDGKKEFEKSCPRGHAESNGIAGKKNMQKISFP